MAASVLLLLGNWIRYAGTRANGGIFWVVILGQILTGLSQPFVLAAPTRYSDMWFTERGRVGATAGAGRECRRGHERPWARRTEVRCLGTERGEKMERQNGCRARWWEARGGAAWLTSGAAGRTRHGSLRPQECRRTTGQTGEAGEIVWPPGETGEAGKTGETGDSADRVRKGPP